MPLLCLICGGEFNVESASACPECGDAVHVPADLEKILTLTISAHELRILTFWADSWARKCQEQDGTMRKVIQTILDRLSSQTEVALSLSQEIADISRMAGAGNVKVVDSDDNETSLLDRGRKNEWR
jgi:hypothetical protein